jgi:lipoprotein-anchoring transpeptidase ErfK/SrfK
MRFGTARVIGFCLLVAGLHAIAASQDAPADDGLGPAVATVLEAQVELHRRGFSCGPIDGVFGAQTSAALQAFQRGAGIAETGGLDPATRDLLRMPAPIMGEHVFTAVELAGLRPVPETWLGKSEQSILAFETALELAAERYRASERLLRRLNPEVDWATLLPGARIIVPAVERAVIARPAAQLVIRLEKRELEVVDADSRVLAHFPVSIARLVEKRPVGELEVTVAIRDPNYTFDPQVFPESAEGRELGRRLIIPPGPNNPVGTAWIGLSRPGYGIHGTPSPERVGRTESHGCFRLANWDAATLLQLVRVGMPVIVAP